MYKNTKVKKVSILIPLLKINKNYLIIFLGMQNNKFYYLFQNKFYLNYLFKNF